VGSTNGREVPMRVTYLFLQVRVNRLGKSYVSFCGDMHHFFLFPTFPLEKNPKIWYNFKNYLNKNINIKTMGIHNFNYFEIFDQLFKERRLAKRSTPAKKDAEATEKAEAKAKEELRKTDKADEVKVESKRKRKTHERKLNRRKWKRELENRWII